MCRKELPGSKLINGAWRYPNGQYKLYWKHDTDDTTNEVLDTELLHLCWLVEETHTNWQKQKYGEWLQDCMNESVVGYVPDYCRNLQGLANIAHATWQQRAIALCKVKGIEIV